VSGAHSPFAVIYTDETTGRQVVERHTRAETVNLRLNELWGHIGRYGPERHKEARGVLGSRVAEFTWRGQ